MIYSASMIPFLWLKKKKDTNKPDHKQTQPQTHKTNPIIKNHHQSPTQSPITNHNPQATKPKTKPASHTHDSQDFSTASVFYGDRYRWWFHRPAIENPLTPCTRQQGSYPAWHMYVCMYVHHMIYRMQERKNAEQSREDRAEKTDPNTTAAPVPD